MTVELDRSQREAKRYSILLMPQHDVILLSPTKRIKLIPPTPLDDEAVAVLRSHTLSRRYLRFLPEKVTCEEAASRRNARSNDPRVFDLHIHIVDGKEGTRFAGTTGFFNIDEANESCEAGILVSPAFYGQGIATEALFTLLRYIFEAKKLHRTTFETGDDNIPMQKWLENVAGIRLEAQRKECWKDREGGTYTDVRGYSVLDWEWRDRVKARLQKAMQI